MVYRDRNGKLHHENELTGISREEWRVMGLHIAFDDETAWDA